VQHRLHAASLAGGEQRDQMIFMAVYAAVGDEAEQVQATPAARRHVERPCDRRNVLGSISSKVFEMRVMSW